MKSLPVKGLWAGWLVFALSLFARGPDTMWTRTYGNESGEEPYDIIQTSDRGYLVAGCTQSYGAGGWDAYLVKTDELGDTLWTKVYGGVGTDVAHAVCSTPDGGYIFAGNTSSFYAQNTDAYVVKIDSTGNEVWTRVFGSPAVDGVLDICPTGSDEYVISGFINAPSQWVGGDVWLAKIDSGGDTVWSRSFGRGGTNKGYSVCKASGGGFVVTGYSSDFGPTGEDIIAIKTDEAGDVLWEKVYGGAENEWAHAVCEASGGYLVAGWTGQSFTENPDVYLLKLDYNGDSLWSRRYGGAQGDIAFDLCPTVDGNFAVAGWSYSFSQNDWPDIWLLKLQESGDTLWSSSYGGEGYEFTHSVIQSADSGYVMAAITNSRGAGESDFLLVKTEPDTAGTTGIVRDSDSCTSPVSIYLTSNPFKKNLGISYYLERDCEVRIAVFDFTGRRLCTLVDGPQLSGTHDLCWDGTDDEGRILANGVYFVKIDVRDCTETARALLIW